MSDFMEITGKSVDDAFMNAIVQLETTSDNIAYEVIDKGSSGILGFGSRPARIKAWIKSKSGSDDDLTNEPVDEASEDTESKKDDSESEDKIRDAVDIVNEDPEMSDNVSKPASARSEIDMQAVDRCIRDFLDNMFKAMDMKVDIDVKRDEAEDCVNVELSGDEMGLLIGKRGQTLDSIQYLISLVVNKENSGYIRIKLDTEDYRRRRKETLESLAKNIAYKVKRSKRPVSLEPMNPYERRIIHSALQSDKFVATRSEGEEPFRHVIVYLKNDYRSNGHDRYKSDYNRK